MSNINIKTKDNGVTCLTVYDTYLYNDDDIEDIVDCILFISKIGEYRNKQSLVNEIRVHKIFYLKGWFKNRTQHSDLEYHQNWLLKLAYSIINKLFKRKE